jgi:hypothetical protein
MRFRYFALLIIPLLLNCPRRYTPKVEKIEVHYLGSLYEDIYREPPLLSGTAAMPGIAVGHLEAEPPILPHILGKLGFYQFLNEFPIDYVLSETLVYNVNFLSIPRDLGYGIENYEGIRFALVRTGADSLTINDEIQLTLLRQRSDVLWIINQDFIQTEPRTIDFYIANRQLADTSISTIEVLPDTALLTRISDFRQRLEAFFETTFILDGKTLDEYILSTVAEQEEVNAIVYPRDVFFTKSGSDTMTLRAMIGTADWELKFQKVADMTQDEISQLAEENEYVVWGDVRRKNSVLAPSNQGTRFFDLFYPITYKIGE